ncbi:MAG: hypothetical protein ACLSEY_09370 [Enterocloster sp.]
MAAGQHIPVEWIPNGRDRVLPGPLDGFGRNKGQIELNSHLRIENDLWYLDGTYTLNGEKMLDAEIFDYDL